MKISLPFNPIKLDLIISTRRGNNSNSGGNLKVLNCLYLKELLGLLNTH